MTALLLAIRQLLATARHIWQDSRVPIFARVQFALAPLYWLNPFDLMPDFLPDGMMDDVIVVPLLMLSAVTLIPRAVFRDARRAAVLGLVCMSVSTSLPFQSAFAFQPSHSHTHFSKPFSAGTAYRLSQESGGERIRAQKKLAARKAPGSDFRTVPSVIRQTGSACSYKEPASQSSRLVCRDRSSGSLTFLTKRGGQFQLYSAESSQPASAASKFPTPLTMPPHSVGGIFVVYVPYFLSASKPGC